MMQASRHTKQRIGSCSSHHIDDPLWNNDHFLRRLAIQRPFDGIKGQDGALNIDVSGIARNGYVRAFPAVHLYRKRDGVFDEKTLLDQWPRLFCDQVGVMKPFPALL